MWNIGDVLLVVKIKALSIPEIKMINEIITSCKRLNVSVSVLMFDIKLV